MKELTKVFNNVEIQVDIIDDRNMYFDISGIANKHNKRFDRYTSRSEFKEILKYVQKCTNLNEAELVKKVGHSINIHNKLLIDFARWISPEFAVAADEIIFDILTGNKKLIETEKQNLIDAIAIKQKYFKTQLEAKDKEIQKAKRKAYAREREGNYQCLTRIIKDAKADISVATLRKILLEEKMVLEKEVVVSVPIANKDESIEENGQILFNTDKVMEIFNKYDIEFIKDSQLTMEFAN